LQDTAKFTQLGIFGKIIIYHLATLAGTVLKEEKAFWFATAAANFSNPPSANF
jgi:hypothetical protein